MTEKKSKLDAGRVANRTDPHTVSNYGQFATEHVDLDWTVDFDARCISGSAVYRIRRLSDDSNNNKSGDNNKESKSNDDSNRTFTSRLHFDAVGITCRDVWYTTKGERVPLSYAHLKKRTQFGGDLEVILPSDLADEVISVGIEYETGKEEACTAAQWLRPEQTVGGKLPYLFTQCQAIHARTLLPCQDTPAIKFTFDATVRIKQPHLATLTILMGANERSCSKDGIATFKQTTKIPAYLLALAIGDLQSRPIGPRSCVWTEPAQLDASAHEFAETDTFLTTCESIAGPYVWGRYDLLVLPPSFPYGGMENPCLTFVSASLLAGDRSLADVVAHEIAHSWTGNLVTARSWEHFWLNEGWTMFLERKVTGKLRGEAYRHFDALLGLNDLRDSVKQQTDLGLDTSLYPDLKDTHPDDAFSTIPYEKGHTLLLALEQAIELSRPGLFDDGAFIRTYVERFAHRSIDVADFMAFVSDWAAANGIAPLVFEWERWLLGQGMPPAKEMPRYDDSLRTQCQAVVAAVLANGETTLPEHLQSTHPTVFILDALTQAQDKLSVDVFERIEAQWGLAARTANVEISQKYLLLALKFGRRVDEAYAFAARHGRMKYHRPIYQALFKMLPERTVAFYRANRQRYHPIAAKLIEKDLGLAQ